MAENQIKKCRDCGEEKEISMFCRRKGRERKDGTFTWYFDSFCKSCKTSRTLDWSFKDYGRIYSRLFEEQIVSRLTVENQKLKDLIFGPVGGKVYPRYVNEYPVCPVNGFELQWITKTPEKEGEPRSFQPVCVRVQ